MLENGWLGREPSVGFVRMRCVGVCACCGFNIEEPIYEDADFAPYKKINGKMYCIECVEHGIEEENENEEEYDD
jgi:hypothetical protein